MTFLIQLYTYIVYWKDSRINTCYYSLLSTIFVTHVRHCFYPPILVFNISVRSSCIILQWLHKLCASCLQWNYFLYWVIFMVSVVLVVDFLLLGLTVINSWLSLSSGGSWYITAEERWNKDLISFGPFISNFSEIFSSIVFQCLHPFLSDHD